jgi:uncharacterized membrane protein YfcA
MSFFKKHGSKLLVGTLAGAINGILGAGGGIIITHYLARSLNEEEKKQNGIFANAVATMLPICAFSLVIYLLKGKIQPDLNFFLILLAAPIGAIFGAILLTKLKPQAAKNIFSILVVISGIMMILR